MILNGASDAVKLHCYKMHGLGNDYIYMLRSELPAEMDLPELARYVSDRHCGVGADGLVLIDRDKNADFSMRIWNADGSQAQMCGNASRCVALLVRRLNLTQKANISLSTLAGIKYLHIDELTGNVTVDMGEPILNPSDIPVAAPEIEFNVSTPHGEMEFVAVSMGNPHGVTFIDRAPDDLLLKECGSYMECHDIWPQKANIEFARILDRNNIEMRVWERGSGETLACGTGACATAVAAILTGRADREVNIHLPGGTLSIEWRHSNNHVYMSGPGTLVAELYYFYPTCL